MDIEPVWIKEKTILLVAEITTTFICFWSTIKSQNRAWMDKSHKKTLKQKLKYKSSTDLNDGKTIWATFRLGPAPK